MTPITHAAACQDVGRQASAGEPGHRNGARLALLIVALVMAVGLPLLSAAPASATVSHCGNGQCTVYLSQSETKRLGAGGYIPAAPSFVPAPIRAIYTATAGTHRWIAKQYGKQNKCSAFTINVRPWVKQGYYSYSCNWR